MTRLSLEETTTCKGAPERAPRSRGHTARKASLSALVPGAIMGLALAPRLCQMRKGGDMAQTLDDRRAAILKAIVQDYVRGGEPIGSKRLVEEWNLGVSAATVRTDMAALEEAGLITHPHTSAGRIPTDAGYRYFVDSMSATEPVRPEQLAALEGLLLGS